jgi:long-chain acyl-CoA synthetase
VPYLKKFRVILDPKLSMANVWDRTSKVYGDKIVSYLEEPLPYPRMPKDELSYRENLALVNMMGNTLRDMGVLRGDRVIIATGNRVELILLSYACFKIGAIAVPLNYMLKGSEIRYITENCGARVLITDRDVFDTNIRSRDSIPSVETWMMVDARESNLPGFVSLDEALDDASAELEPVNIHKHETIAIFYTSGTTGYPKGAMMTSHNLLTTQRITGAVLPVGPDDLGVSALPSAHLMGFAVALITFLIGTPGYFMKYFQPKKVLRAIQDKKAGVFVGVPAMYSILIQANENEEFDLSSVKLWASGADAMPVDQIKKFVGYGGIFFEGYGQVETSPITSIKVSTKYWTFKHGCVGIPVWPVRTQVWDEECRRLPTGEPGELVVRGPNVTKGYWNDSERNEEAYRGGWFHTGDMAYKARFGLLYFVDRKKDVVKAGGYSVFSKEVEEEIRSHPRIEDVAIVGLPHPTKVEVVAAVCTITPGEPLSGEELMAWCKENIAAYKAPRYVEIRSEMPYGMTLKVLKRVLREELTQKVDVSQL